MRTTIAIPILALVGSAAFALTSVRAQIGEDFAHLRALYGTATFDGSSGSPIDSVALPPSGIVTWKSPNGQFLAIASFIDGKAACILYGDVNETASDMLRRQMLPVGQEWMDGKDAKVFLEKVAEESSLPLFDPTGLRYWQTSDGRLWAVWSARSPMNIFYIGTPDGFKSALGLALKWGLPSS